MKIHLIDPFLGGSHKKWAEELSAASRHDIQLLGLPGKNWKWRMQASAPVLAERAADHDPPELYLCSDMLHLPVFHSFLPETHREAPLLLYMHENQITYPWSPKDPDQELDRDRTYGLINILSAMRANLIAFNSEFHRQSFLYGMHSFLQKFPKPGLLSHTTSIEKKSTVLPIGLSAIGAPSPSSQANHPPVIVWNHRWEYDKRPEAFFDLLYQLKDQHIPFRLIVMGSHRASYPSCFDRAREDFREEILHFGFAEDRKTYVRLLQQGDVLPVTSAQDFFGISVVEAISAGLYPLLPDRLAYPEHLPKKFHPNHLYTSEDELFTQLKAYLKSPSPLSPEIHDHISQYHWPRIIDHYDQLFASFLKNP